MRLPLEFIGADMSATTRTKWLKLPSGAKKVSIGLGWPATDTPNGTLSIQVSNHGIEGVAGAAYPTTIATNPAGSAATVLLDNIETSAEFLTVVYTRSSGGAGAVFTDDSGVAGRKPQLIVKE